MAFGWCPERPPGTAVTPAIAKTAPATNATIRDTTPCLMMISLRRRRESRGERIPQLLLLRNSLRGRHEPGFEYRARARSDCAQPAPALTGSDCSASSVPQKAVR